MNVTDSGGCVSSTPIAIETEGMSRPRVARDGTARKKRVYEQEGIRTDFRMTDRNIGVW